MMLTFIYQCVSKSHATCARIILAASFIFFLVYNAQCQGPLTKIWDYRFGGTNIDITTAFEATADGGYIIGGYTLSQAGGDKTEPTWNFTTDFWIVKTNAQGSKEWDKNFGGYGADYLYKIKQTRDGGYILGGYSNSSAGGDKTQNAWGNTDYWVVKIDSLGNKEWDKDFGGNDFDYLYALLQTSDGGYLLAGHTQSGISGDKTQPSWGGDDFWILKTDSSGNKLWDKRYGGSSRDWLYAMEQTNDHGFILAGYSSSPISGDKSEAPRGNDDYWIVKIDSIGNKLWDKRYGGTSDDFLSCVSITPDGGYILGGTSKSSFGGDKTQSPWSFGITDWWIVKVDSTGNKQWDQVLGGTLHEDEINSVLPSSDGGYIIGGTSYSGIGGNKTTNNMGVEQIWIVKTNAVGYPEWDRTVLTTGHDEAGFLVSSSEGCYTAATWSDAGIGGDKTQDTQGNSDYWMVKLCDTLVHAAFTTVNGICPGTCIAFTNLSHNGITYQWSFPGAVPSISTDVNPINICYAQPGSYSVQLISSNSFDSDTLLLPNYVTVYPFPLPQSISQSADTLFALLGAASYQWYFNSNSISGATDYFYIATQSGNYNVVATDNNGCEVEAAILNVIASIETFDSNGNLLVFPNPVDNTLSVISYTLSGKANSMLVFNMMGEKQQVEVNNAGNSLTINVENLSPGIYFLEVRTGDISVRNKFIKQ